MDHEGCQLWSEDSHCPGGHEHMPIGFLQAGLKKTTKAWTPGYLLDVNIYKKEDHNQKEKAKLLSKVFYVFNLLISEHTWCNTGPLQTANASLNVK